LTGRLQLQYPAPMMAAPTKDGGASSAPPHAFIASGQFHQVQVDRDPRHTKPRRFALCAVCGGVKRWSCHHGGSKAKRPKHWAGATPKPTLAPAATERPQPPVPISPAPPAHPWQLYALEAALEAVMPKAVDFGYPTQVLLADALRAVRSELHPSTVRRTPVYEPAPVMSTEPPTLSPTVQHFPPRTPAPTGSGGETRRRLIAGIRSDQLRKIAVRAFEQNWQAKVLGDGHLRFMGPDGGHFVLSMTSKDTARSFPNVKAAAKRAGLDTSGL